MPTANPIITFGLGAALWAVLSRHYQMAKPG
jgi:hypothetical protein